MSYLWQLLNNTVHTQMKTLLTAVIVIVAVLCIVGIYRDIYAPPLEQISTKVALSVINVYQMHMRDAASHVFVCRFQPSCSEYSKECLTRYGFPKGFYLSFARIWKCKKGIAMGTVDAPP